MPFQTITIHPAAPLKPPADQPCNGCGLCCLTSPCPVSAVFLGHRSLSCPALVWQDSERQYRCGMLLTPERYCRWLPAPASRFFIVLIRRWLAIGIGCDADVEIEFL